MSEIVQRHMETMTQEFEDMSRTKLFTTEESRKVMKKRKEFEYKINGIQKNLQDFKDYILYEEILLKTMKLRRNKFKIGEKKSTLEQRVTTRIKSLYQTAIKRFPNNLELYLQFFKFCKQVNYIHVASSVIKQLLEHFPQNVETWQLAARWYAYDRKDVEKGIKLLYKAIALHKDSKILYTDVIKLELLKAEETSESDEEQRKCAKKIQTYVDEAICNINDCKYFIALLGYLEDYEFTVSAQNLICDYLLRNFGHDSEVKKIVENRKHNINTDQEED